MRAPELLQRCVAQLTTAGVSDASLSARYCLAKALGGKTLSVADSALARTARISASQAETFSNLCDRRSKREPLQYIVGDWDFDILRDVRVRPPILIPRSETEELVGLASIVIGALLHSPGSTQHQQSDGARQALHAAVGTMNCRNGEAQFLEVGCGSGVIGIALAKRFPQKVLVHGSPPAPGFPAIDPVLKPRLQGLSIDISAGAVALARENRDEQDISPHQLQIAECSYRDLGPNASLAGSAGINGPFDLLVSNPPYVPDDDIAGLEPEVRDWEDRGALAGGSPHGLGLILDMLACAGDRKWLVPGGLALLETDRAHPAMLAWLLGTRGGLTLHGASSFGQPATTEVDVEAAINALPASELAQLQAWAAIEHCKRFRDQWRLAAAFRDHADRPRFVVLQTTLGRR